MKSFEKLKSSFTIGDASVGTRFWLSEMDSEFTRKLGLDISKYEPQAQRGPSLSTPRSLKKGFVTVHDYEAIKSQESKAKDEAEDARHELMTARQLKESWKGDEEVLLRSMTEEHELQTKAKSQLFAALDTLRLLEEQAGLSKALMSEMAATHGITDRASARPRLPSAKVVATSPGGERENKLMEMEEEIQLVAGQIQHMSGSGGKKAGGTTLSRPASARSPYQDRSETYRRRTELDLCHWRP